MASWIHNGHKCSKCGYHLAYSAECYRSIEPILDTGYQYAHYIIHPGVCPRCNDIMTNIVYEEEGTDVQITLDKSSGWYWDNYQYDWCCKYCGARADHRTLHDGDPFTEPQFDFCPHCGKPMKGDIERGKIES